MKQVLQILLFLLLADFASAQRAITGKITTKSGEPLTGATVLVKGTSQGAVSDIDGRYSLNITSAAKTIVFSYIGYESQEVDLGNSNVIDVVLKEAAGLLENIVVIGSRNQTRTKLTTPVAVDVIPVSQVVNEVGQVDVNQILTYVAPSFQSARQTVSDGTDHIDPAQLRGLGPDQVLVLVNGKRRHQSALVNVNGTVNRGTVGTDLNAIPASSIERIEILRDGAAAQYGSDAIAGVINIVLKSRTGLTVNLSGGQNITQYDKNYAQYKITNNSADPSVKVNDGTTLQMGANYGIKVGTKGFLNITGEYTQRGETNRTGTFTGQVYPNINGKDRSDSIIAAKGLTRDFFDMRIGNSRVKGGGVMINGEFGINENWAIYTFGGYNVKKGNAAGFYRYPTGVPAAARTNVFEKYPNGFLPEINSDVSDLSFAAGVRGKWNQWNVDFSNTLGKNTFDYTITNSVNYTQAINTADFQTDFDAGGNSFLQNTTNLDLSRKFVVLQGLNFAFGAEHRLDQYSIRAGEEASWKNYNTPSGAASGAQVFAGFFPQNAGTHSRNSVAGYVDAELDITKAWMIGTALRFENYSDFGSTFNYKAVSRYKFGEWLSLRAATSTGFRAPSLQQRFYAKTNTLFVSQGGTLVPVESGTFTNDSKVAELLGIPELKQETSTNYSAGFTSRPIDGLEITVDAYQINIKDRIVLTNNFTGGTDANLTTQLAAQGASAANVFTNAIDTKSQGIEAVISYGKKFGANRNQEFRIMAAGTYIKNEVVKNADGTPKVNASTVLLNSGQLGNYFNREDQSRIEVANPRDKVSITANYKWDNFGIMVRAVRFGEVTYIDPTINPAKPENFPANAFNNGAKETLDQTFSPKIVTDATLSYKVWKGLTLSVGANNIFDVYQDKHAHSGNMSSGRFVYSRRVQQMGFNGRYVFGRLTFDLK